MGPLWQMGPIRIRSPKPRVLCQRHPGGQISGQEHTVPIARLWLTEDARPSGTRRIAKDSGEPRARSLGIGFSRPGFQAVF
jgi:hypothetical protein